MRSFLPLLAVVALSAHAQEATPADAPINSLSDCVIQEVLPGKHMTGAFFKLIHEGAPQTLVGAKIPSITDDVELHSMEVVDGIMSMKQIHDYPIKAGETRFKKGSYHLMLMKIPQNPEIGSTHDITLKFADGSSATCSAIVKTVAEVIDEAEAGGMNNDADVMTKE